LRKIYPGIILIWIIAFCGLVNGQSRPQWLYQPPQVTGYIFSVGISPLYRADSLSFQNARLNAIEELTKQYQVRIVSKRAERQLTSRSLSYQYTIESIDSLHYWQCYKNAIVLDSVLTSEYAYMLLCVTSELSKPSSIQLPLTFSRFDDEGREKPSWINNPPEKPGVIYGIGLSQPYRQEDDAWANSVTQARRDLAFSIMADRSYLESNSNSGRWSYYSKWSETETELILRNNFIRARWYDTVNDLYYTLIELINP